MIRKRLPSFSREEIGTIGSYSSFLALLLVATVLAYREIFNTLYDLAQSGLSGSLLHLVFAIMMVIFALIFIGLPAIPIVKDIIVNFREKSRRMAWALIFIACVYDFAVVFQLIHSYLDKLGG